MYKRYSGKFKRNMVIIYPGEFYVSTQDIIATVLGSCISVCIKDKKTGLAGMNHFMLPGDVRSEEMFLSASAKYGMFAMEQLINEMIKRKGSKKDFEAKVFGGGHVLNFRKTDSNVPESNIDFVRAFLRMEQIAIVKEDVGGYSGRKILFFPETAKVLLQRLESSVDSKVIQAELSYKTRLFREKEKLQQTGGDLTLF
ncbi:MAG: Chemoreceptor glutamine deamidase CheD [Deltaproteobacteria bacterium ADurb.BinA179]|jgi:chemotaxis protein CheD|nr:chemoreceptor glutamine deamidase CheD [Pseudomonadota bacterium]OPZ30331.1 MAG: Chemoreceptor glutamine deamidase CheD [Deltaproteobacteria bacterium ADurb.BinA179]HNU75129.1 chemoreceptor glutamine deamidase CheD [Deltaproteobacteria bacterium]HOD69813.1 chemoreceptor glutamine deamidase CheD [Deltaproteobacteria bacterium]HPV30250.1 chemoreceptor glutamine deamidase CheD [Deltaproteobacteria bacterium]